MNSTVVVTGSTRGIGRAIAMEMAQAGAHVIVHGHRSTTSAEEVAKEVKALGSSAHVIMCDISNREAVETFVEQAFQWRQGVDVWVNNAGFDVLTGESAKLSFSEKLEKLWAVDVLGTIACSRMVGQRMKQAGRGQIINIGWDQACHGGMEGESGEMFATTKGAVMAFSQSLAKSLAPEVRVNCVAPGWIKTEWGEDHASDYWHRRAIGESLRARWGTPEDVAAAVRFLASPAADFINGHILPVNGGFRPASPKKEG